MEGDLLVTSKSPKEHKELKSKYLSFTPMNYNEGSDHDLSFHNSDTLKKKKHKKHKRGDNNEFSYLPHTYTFNNKSYTSASDELTRLEKEELSTPLQAKKKKHKSKCASINDILHPESSGPGDSNVVLTDELTRMEFAEGANGNNTKSKTKKKQKHEDNEKSKTQTELPDVGNPERKKHKSKHRKEKGLSENFPEQENIDNIQQLEMAENTPHSSPEVKKHKQKEKNNKEVSTKQKHNKFSDSLISDRNVAMEQVCHQELCLEVQERMELSKAQADHQENVTLTAKKKKHKKHRNGEDNEFSYIPHSTTHTFYNESNISASDELTRLEKEVLSTSLQAKKKKRKSMCASINDILHPESSGHGDSNVVLTDILTGVEFAEGTIEDNTKSKAKKKRKHEDGKKSKTQSESFVLENPERKKHKSKHGKEKGLNQNFPEHENRENNQQLEMTENSLHSSLEVKKNNKKVSKKQKPIKFSDSLISDRNIAMEHFNHQKGSLEVQEIIKLTKDKSKKDSKVISDTLSCLEPGSSMNMSYQNFPSLTEELDMTEEPVHFEVPMLHQKEIVRSLNKAERDELIASGITIRTGRWSKSENDIIQRNWAEFISSHQLCDPLILLGVNTKSIDKKYLSQFIKAKHFYIRLAKDLNQRPLSTIYKHSRALFAPYKDNGKLNVEEMDVVRNLKDVYGYKWGQISNVVEKTADRCKTNYRSHENSQNKKFWTKEEDERLVSAVTELCGNDLNITTLRNSGIPWTAISKMVKTRNSFQCREHWLNTLFPVPSDKIKHKFRKKEKARLIVMLHQNLVNKEELVDWQTLYKSFSYCLRSYASLMSRWRMLKRKVPDFANKDYKSIVEYLYTNTLKSLLRKCHLTMDEILKMAKQRD